MAMVPQRFENVRRAVRVGRIVWLLSAITLVVAAIMLFTGQSETGDVHLPLGICVLAGALLLASVLILGWGLMDIFLKIEANTFRMYGLLRDLQGDIEHQKEQLRVIADNAQLSDTARAITHRGKERTALRLAINEEIIRGDWEAAYSLVELLEARHGYKNEAMRLRRELDASRQRDRADKLQEAVEQVRALMAAQDWDRARREMDRLMAAHPEVEELRDLPKLFAKYRNDHKRRLLKAWDESVQRNEVDRGIAILKELDQFLMPNEAAALEESARGVFRAKLHNLGVQFSLAAADHSWRAALDAGLQIVQEFPNSRMAQEVRERMDLLKKRAEELEGSNDEAAPPAPAAD
ncbi:MAG: hypothetical protein ABII12_05055 [Planctomycetota bacterium]